MTRSLLIDFREALLSNRCASRKSIRRLRVIDRPPRLRAILETLMRADTPPNLGGEFGLTFRMRPTAPLKCDSPDVNAAPLPRTRLQARLHRVADLGGTLYDANSSGFHCRHLLTRR